MVKGFLRWIIEQTMTYNNYVVYTLCAINSCTHLCTQDKCLNQDEDRTKKKQTIKQTMQVHMNFLKFKSLINRKCFSIEQKKKTNNRDHLTFCNHWNKDLADQNGFDNCFNHLHRCLHVWFFFVIHFFPFDCHKNI